MHAQNSPLAANTKNNSSKKLVHIVIKYLIKFLEKKLVSFKLLLISRRLIQSSELKRLQFLSTFSIFLVNQIHC